MSDLLNQASLVMVPSGYKEDTVYSVVPTDGSGDFSFTRASNGTRVNSAGLVEVCPWNLLTYSEDLSNGAWSPQGSSVTTDSTTAPNGTTTADTLIESNTTDEHNRFQTINISGQYTFSVYLKKYNVDWCALYVFNPSVGGIRYWINVNTLTAGTSANIGGGIGTTSLSLESVGNGWVRASILFNNPSGDCRFYVANAQSNGGATTYAGNGTSGVYVWGAQVNLGTLKPYFPTTDRLNVPRLTYQNGGGGCPSLLLEKQSTNLLSYSEQFDNAGWSKYQGGTITANSVTSPDGTQNADTLNVASGQTYSGIYQSVSGSSDVYTISIFAKYNTKRWMFIFDASASGQGWFDLQNGVLGTIPSGHTGTIENFGNGWYRCTFKKNTAVTPAFFQIGLVDGDGESTPSSNGSSYIWGAQFEASSYPTSYIPTTSSSATRVADACYKTGISSLIGQTEGTIFVDVDLTHTSSGNDYILQIFQDSSNRILLYRGLGNVVGCYLLKAGGSIYDTLTVSAFTGRTKLAFAYKSGSIAFYVNGSQIGTSSATFTAFSSLSDLNIDSNNNTENGYFSYNEAVLFPTRLTNAELASLTTI